MIRRTTRGNLKFCTNSKKAVTRLSQMALYDLFGRNKVVINQTLSSSVVSKDSYIDPARQQRQIPQRTPNVLNK
jgi:hypothetical protein